MNPDARAAHERLAALPRTVHRREPQEQHPGSFVGHPIEGRRPGRPAAIQQPPATRSGKPRSQPIYASIPNRWGFVRGEALQIADDGKSWSGMRVQYAGTSSSDWAYVRASGMKVSVRADRLRRVGR